MVFVNTPHNNSNNNNHNTSTRIQMDIASISVCKHKYLHNSNMYAHMWGSY